MLSFLNSRQTSLQAVFFSPQAKSLLIDCQLQRIVELFE